MENILLKTYLLAGLLVLVSFPTLAQGAPPATPIDGGLSLLLIAGSVYGVKKIKDARKQN